MHSDELFPATHEKNGQSQWEGLEKRINRLLEGIVQLRSANAQLMKENVLLKNQMKEAPEASDNGSTQELESLKKKYEEALTDLKKLRQNLQRLETLTSELKLEEHKS